MSHKKIASAGRNGWMMLGEARKGTPTQHVILGLIVALAGAGGATRALAGSYQYVYTGSPFDTVATSTGPTGPAPGDLSGLTIDFTFSSPLAPNSTVSSPSSWTLTDGFTTYSSATPGVALSFYATTNSAGAITTWDINIAGGGLTTGNILSEYWTSSNAFQLPVNNVWVYDQANYAYELSGGNFSATSYFGATAAGTWSSSAAPLPAAAWLLLSGLGGLGFFGRMRLSRH